MLGEFIMSNALLRFLSATSGALICGFIGALTGAIAARGTSVLLPGLGLIIAGPLVAGFVAGLLGMILGAVIGLLVAAKVIRNRRLN